MSVYAHHFKHFIEDLIVVSMCCTKSGHVGVDDKQVFHRCLQSDSGESMATILDGVSP